MQNLVSLVLTEQDLADFDAALATLRRLMAPMVVLQPDQRRELKTRRPFHGRRPRGAPHRCRHSGAGYTGISYALPGRRVFKQVNSLLPHHRNVAQQHASIWNQRWCLVRSLASQARE